MTSIVMPPGSMGVDGVSLSTLRDFSKVREAGFQWVSLYLGGNYGVKSYAIEAAWAAGLPVMLNYERSASDAKNGYPAGKRAAETALTQASALGFRGEAPLPFSAADEHFVDLAGAGLDYHRALVDVLTPQGWVGGAYGFREMLALIDKQGWWPATWPLWHWGGDGSTIYPWTWVKQGPGGSYFDKTIGLQVDRNKLYKPMRFWSGYGPDHVDPQEDDMTPAQEAKLDSVIAADAAILVGLNDIMRVLWAEDQETKRSMYFASQETRTLIAQVIDMIRNLSLGGGGVTPDQIADELARRLTQDA